MDFSDFLTLGDSGIGDMISSGGDAPADFGGISAVDYFGSLIGGGGGDELGGGMFGTDDASMSSLYGLPDFSGVDPSILSSLGGGNDGGSSLAELFTNGEDGKILGSSGFGKVWDRIKDRWDKDPLSMINSGIGIIAILDQMKKAKRGGRSGGGDAAWNVIGSAPPRAEEPFRAANPAASTFPERVAPQPAGGLAQAVQIPIYKG